MEPRIISNLPPIAYFSMEIGIDASLPTYAGGLGVLAGDVLATGADLELPMVGVTLLYHQGYFRQHLDAEGNQTESPYLWDPQRNLELMEPKVQITLEGRPITIQAWRFTVYGITRRRVLVYFLDTLLPENDPRDQTLTDSLYLGDDRFRLMQEAILGLGGFAMLRALGHGDTKIYHLNEGHSALLTVGLLEELTKGRGLKSATEADQETVRHHCVFTTHTPVPAGHDQFPGSLVTHVLGEERAAALEAIGSCPHRQLNMTALALHFSRYVNGVAMRHMDISQGMFPNYPIESISNGVNALTWVSPQFEALYARYIPNWRYDNFYLRHAIRIPLAEIREAHQEAKMEFFSEVRKRTGISLDPASFTLGFARRATAYKRPNLLFNDIERLRKISQEKGRIQVVFAGKAHPKDEPGKDLIRQIFRAAKTLSKDVSVVYLEEYDMALAKLFCAGVDVWLNTPNKPQEASGTSGMKAALNGIPSFSILDGWWVEGHVEGVTGWSIGEHWEDTDHHDEEAKALYDKLENILLPLFYHRPEDFDWVRQMTIVHNGSFFNAQRMMFQYLKHAYLNF
jgi:glycogen phosphorylase